MAAQTVYNINMTKGYPGQVANIANSDVVTGVVDIGETILPGIWVQRIAAAVASPVSYNKGANNIAAPGGGVAADNLGVAVRDLGREGAPQTASISYEEAEQFPVMRSGYIYLTIPSGGIAGNSIKFNNTTGVMDAYSGTPGAGETGIVGAKLETNTTAGEVGLVWIPAQVNFSEAV